MKARAHRNRPYGLLARFYAQVMPGIGEMNRHARTKVLGPILEQAESVCDVGVGGGDTLIDLARSGKRVFGVDSSPRFLRDARARLRKEKLSATLVRGDLCDFELPERVDLVLCEFATLNNLDERAALPRAVESLARAVRPGGHVLFDVNAPKSFETQIGSTHWFEGREFKLVLRSAREGRELVARLDLEWFLLEKRRYRHVRETIVNVGWTDAQMRRALKSAGLRLVRVFDGVDVRPPYPGAVRGTDLYYLARKPVATGQR